jgi:hypothetical protein
MIFSPKVKKILKGIHEIISQKIGNGCEDAVHFGSTIQKRKKFCTWVEILYTGFPLE